MHLDSSLIDTSHILCATQGLHINKKLEKHKNETHLINNVRKM